MTDQLYLSVWLERHARAARRRQFIALLRLFPFSQREEQPQTTVSIRAVAATEPVLLERAMNGPVDPDEVAQVLADHEADDVAYEVESFWDLWQWQGDWVLAPARVILGCYGPEYDNGTARQAQVPQEDLRIDFGVDSHYLPDTEIPGSTRMVESNIKSLLRLVHEIDSALPVAERRLETETGGNFAERLQQTLSVASTRPS